MANRTSVRIRMHRMGELGDCFLLTFSAGIRKSQMLIDCGNFRNVDESVDRLGEVVGAIRKELKGKPLDVVVGTHQHNDHLNGFHHFEDEFRKMGVEQVWLSWLDDPADELAREIGAQYNNLRVKLTGAATRLRQLRGSKAEDNELERLVGFLGAKKTDGKPAFVPEEARVFLQGVGRKAVNYLRPGMSLDLPGLPAKTVRVHVLGPPRNQDELERKDPRAGESYDKELARVSATSDRFFDALGQHTLGATADAQRARKRDARPIGELREEREYPFSEAYKQSKPEAYSAKLRAVVERYGSAAYAWRNIDEDWKETGDAMALWMDTYTNNTSMVLAIELVDSAKVLLFAADAQTGNWSSWKDVKWKDEHVSTQQLLDRTVFYKVGHHGSHNSTHKEVFDSMRHPDLVALIPVDKSDSHITAKKRGWKMPAEKLFEEIKKKTSNRVLQMDGKDDPDCDPNKAAVKARWKKAGFTINPKAPLFVEVKL